MTVCLDGEMKLGPFTVSQYKHSNHSAAASEPLSGGVPRATRAGCGAHFVRGLAPWRAQRAFGTRPLHRIGASGRKRPSTPTGERHIVHGDH
jgi:hypothetical protein